jgi:sarcosine oxidase, subunit gamma
VSERGNHELGSMVPGHYGAAGTNVVLTVATITAAWNLQGDPARSSVVADATSSFGVALPLDPDTTSCSDALIAFWLGPRSWLLVESAASADAATLVDYDARRDALNANGGALFDVSASRIAYVLRGSSATAVLAQGCPLDLDPRAFAPGRCAQSVFGHVSVLYYRHEDADTWTVFVARSLAADVWHALCVAAAGDGYEVSPPSAAWTRR